MRAERDSFEAALGIPVTTFDDPGTVAPKAFESFIVRSAESQAVFLRRGADLGTREAFREAVRLAVRAPGTVVMGPAFVGPEDDRFAILRFAGPYGQVDLRWDLSPQ